MFAAPSPATAAPNPFSQPSALPFQAPPFDKITDADYQPAIEECIRDSLAEIRQIADNPASPTFENTIVGMERQGQMLSRAQLAFGQVAQAHTNPTLQKAQAALGPKLAVYNDAIFLDAKLFARVKALYEAQVLHGGMTRPNGQRFRDLSRVHTQDYNVMFRNMVGHEPEVGPLLVKHGLGGG
jgi:Zn-dependent oligopeptidase